MSPDTFPIARVYAGDALEEGPVKDEDGVHYPVCDNMGESVLQIDVNSLLRGLLQDYFAATGRRCFVGSNQFAYYERGNPRACVSPDVYVIDDEDASQRELRSWKLWEHGGKAPTLALEVVSDEYRKDYADELVARYQALGVRELIRYDPEPRGRTRRTLSHFVREATGKLVERLCSAERVYCSSYDLWLVQQADLSLRIGLGPEGAALWPTQAEARAREAEARAREAEARRAAEVELVRVQAELAELRAARGLSSRT